MDGYTNCLSSWHQSCDQKAEVVIMPIKGNLCECNASDHSGKNRIVQEMQNKLLVGNASKWK